MFFFLLPWKHAYLSYSQHLRFKNIPSEISHDAMVIESLIFLLLSSFCPENSTLVQVFNKIGLIFTFLSTALLIWDLERITISPTRIPFPVLGHLILTSPLRALIQYLRPLTYPLLQQTLFSSSPPPPVACGSVTSRRV